MDMPAPPMSCHIQGVIDICPMGISRLIFSTHSAEMFATPLLTLHLRLYVCRLCLSVCECQRTCVQFIAVRPTRLYFPIQRLIQQPDSRHRLLPNYWIACFFSSQVHRFNFSSWLSRCCCCPPPQSPAFCRDSGEK